MAYSRLPVDTTRTVARHLGKPSRPPTRLMQAHPSILRVTPPIVDSRARTQIWPSARGYFAAQARPDGGHDPSHSLCRHRPWPGTQPDATTNNSRYEPSVTRG